MTHRVVPFYFNTQKKRDNYIWNFRLRNVLHTCKCKYLKTQAPPIMNDVVCRIDQLWHPGVLFIDLKPSCLNSQNVLMSEDSTDIPRIIHICIDKWCVSLLFKSSLFRKCWSLSAEWRQKLLRQVWVSGSQFWRRFSKILWWESTLSISQDFIQFGFQSLTFWLPKRPGRFQKKF